MEASLESHPPNPDAILKLVKDAIGKCRESSIKLCGFARGLEIGISTLQGATANDSVDCLQERSLIVDVPRSGGNSGLKSR